MLYLMYVATALRRQRCREYLARLRPHSVAVWIFSDTHGWTNTTITVEVVINLADGSRPREWCLGLLIRLRACSLISGVRRSASSEGGPLMNPFESL
jgi:hypothetical protein